VTYNQLIQRFEWWADAHPMVQQFTHGQFELHDLDKSTPYPAVHVQLADVSFEERVRVYRFEVFVMELHRVNDGEAAAVREDLSNTLQIFEDLIAELRNGFEVFDRKDFLPRFPITPRPFIQEHNGVLTGFQGTIEIETGFGADACDSPLLSHLPPSQLCPDATVTINGTTIGTVGAGETLAALVQYENGVPVGSLVSGVWTIPSIACPAASITTNADSPALSVASGASQDIDIHDTAGADVGTRSGATVTVGDTTVTVNSSAYDTTEAESTFNVEVVDGGDVAVGSLSGGKWVVPDEYFVAITADEAETTLEFTVYFKDGGTRTVTNQTLTNGSIDTGGVVVNAAAGVNTFVGVSLSDGDTVELTYTASGGDFLVELEF
jgi:hypothetical protein